MLEDAAQTARHAAHTARLVALEQVQTAKATARQATDERAALLQYAQRLESDLAQVCCVRTV